jgi:quinol monooxygenase YgiN
MILVTARVRARAERRLEFLQTLRALVAPTRKERGCISCHWHVDIEDEDSFRLVEEWETQQDLENHVKSDHVRVLTGAILLLCEPAPQEINTFADIPETDVVKTVLGRRDHA